MKFPATVLAIVIVLSVLTAAQIGGGDPGKKIQSTEALGNVVFVAGNWFSRSCTRRNADRSVRATRAVA